jgi:hypothetical protein
MQDLLTAFWLSKGILSSDQIVDLITFDYSNRLYQ